MRTRNIHMNEKKKNMEKDNNLKLTLLIQRGMMLMYVVLAVAIVVVFETGVMTGGIIADEPDFCFAGLTVMEIVTICSIPAALKLMSLKKIRQRIAEKGIGEYRRWAVVRLDLVGAPMILNLFLYYMSYSVAFGYMAIIAALCLVFVYPSEGRCLNEMNVEK